VVTRYDDALHVLNEPLLFSAERFAKLSPAFASQRPAVVAVGEVLRHWVVYRDPPHHTRIRGLLNKTFTPRQLEGMRQRIATLVDGMLDAVAEQGEMDFIRDLAFPLPATVIAVMMGVPTADIDLIKTWSDQVGAYIGGRQNTGQDNFALASEGVLAMRDYFRTVVADRKRRPGEDLISLLLGAEEDGNAFGDDEVVANAVLLMFAGHETTTNLLGNGLYHLLHHPAQLRRLLADPGLVDSAVEEFLRYDGPVPGVIKVATADTTLGGQAIGAGEQVMVMLSAANRDEAHFAEPETLDVGRAPNRHLAFAHGIHFCLGAPLARLEGRIAFGRLLTRCAELHLTESEPPWRPQIFLRGLERLPVAFTPVAKAAPAGA
jgi:hypothetical protein